MGDLPSEVLIIPYWKRAQEIIYSITCYFSLQRCLELSSIDFANTASAAQTLMHPLEAALWAASTEPLIFNT